MVLAGVLLLVAGLRRSPVAPAPVRTVMISSRIQRLLSGQGRLTQRTKALLLVGMVGGLLVWLISGWLIAVLVLPAALAGLPALLVSPESKAAIERVAAMEEWTRGLAGVLTVGVGLEQALIATLKSTPDAIRPEVSTLVARIRGRWDTPAALRAFADDLDDATGDLIASSLLLGAQRRGAGLASVLEGLAQTVADDVRIRRAIEADRAKPRTTARWVTLITIGVLGFFSLNRSYIAPYGSGLGQMVLLLLLSAYVGALLWMRKMAQGAKLPRFLGQQVAMRGERA
jgi:Flp pilus assembly protein TadB